MSINVGDRMPAGEFYVTTESGPGKLSTAELFAGKKVVLFGVPGAFTSTCSKSHLPGFVTAASALREAGVDTIACVSVNDAAVMHAWGLDRNVGDDVLMLADGNADYARALGLDVDISAFGMGVRSQRFAIIADDGVVTHLAIDEPGKFEVTSADAMLQALQAGL